METPNDAPQHIVSETTVPAEVIESQGSNEAVEPECLPAQQSPSADPEPEYLPAHQSLSDSPESVNPRRSTRSTAGQHPNPYRQPESAVRVTSSHMTVTDSVQSDFVQLSQALVGLGEMLAKRLGGRLLTGWSASFGTRRSDGNIKEL